MENLKIEWQSLEYEEKMRGKDWFWALGVVVVAGSIASIIFKNYFFAILLVMGGLMLAFFANKKPNMISHELNEKGLKIRTELFPFQNIKSFWVQIGAKPTLFIKLNRAIMPMISMPIEGNQAEEIKAFMLEKNIPEEEMKEHVSEKIMEVLGF